MNFVLAFLTSMITVMAIGNVADSRRFLHFCGGELAMIGSIYAAATQSIGMAIFMAIIASFNFLCAYGRH